MEALKKVKDGKELEPIKSAMTEMDEAVQKIGAAMYQQQAQSAGAAGPEAETKSDDDKKSDKDAVEGDFEEVKDEDKKDDKK